MVASDKGHRILVRSGRSDRSGVEYDCDRRLGRYEIARGTISEDRQFECTDAVRATRRNRVRESDWNGTHRETPSANGRLYFGGNGEARSDVMDFAKRGAAMRNRNSECAASETNGTGKLVMEREKDSDSRRRSIEAADFDAVFCVAQGCGAFFGGI